MYYFTLKDNRYTLHSNEPFGVMLNSFLQVEATTFSNVLKDILDQTPLEFAGNVFSIKQIEQTIVLEDMLSLESTTIPEKVFRQALIDFLAKENA